jgi:leucyl aminopeptidase
MRSEMLNGLEPGRVRLMAEVVRTSQLTSSRQVFEASGGAGPVKSIWLVRRDQSLATIEGLSPAHCTWLTAQGFTGQAKRHILLPGVDGSPGGVAFGVGDGASGDPCGPAELLIGLLPGLLPAGTWTLANTRDHAELAAIAWGLGAYKFQRYKTANGAAEQPVLRLNAGADLGRVSAIVDGVWQGRDLINTPSNDMGPAELEAAARAVAAAHGVAATSIVGDDLLAHNCGLLHAVGRASPRAPRLVDFSWGRPEAPKITLVGKGICFDTGGLDIKPASGMLIMKKDMGGAASVLALAHMIMAAKLDVRLRVLIAAAENSIAGNAFRPGDVIKSRAGKTVEIGNTDAEGRLVLADALSFADEDAPDMILTFATLTGAARVALGPDLPPLFCDDDDLAGDLQAAGLAVGDPVWRLPFWPGYDRLLDSEVADMNNAPDSPFGGAITAALFLRRYVVKAKRYAHIDMYGWRQAPRPLGPKGGEAHAARAVFEALRRRFAN